MVKKPDVLLEASWESSEGRPESDHFSGLVEEDASFSRRRTSGLGYISKGDLQTIKLILTSLVAWLMRSWLSARQYSKTDEQQDYDVSSIPHELL